MSRVLRSVFQSQVLLFIKQRRFLFEQFENQKKPIKVLQNPIFHRKSKGRVIYSSVFNGLSAQI